MNEIKKGINPNLMPIFTQKIESKSTAIQYALDVTAAYDENGIKKFHFDKAKEVLTSFVRAWICRLFRKGYSTTWMQILKS